MIQGTANAGIAELKRKKLETAILVMDGRASLGEIAHKLVAEFPKRFSSWQEALSYAGVVSQEYGHRLPQPVPDCPFKSGPAGIGAFIQPLT